MSEPVTAAQRELLFQRSPVTHHDQRLFIAKLLVALLLAVAGVALVIAGSAVFVIAGIIVLGAVYTHMVELQHQCLHHSAFVRPAPHRMVGVVLGLPLLISYSHYRVRHLQHHKYLGTAKDTEFFGFDTRKPLTYGSLARGMFDYRRLVRVVFASWQSWRGNWRFENGQISERLHRDSVFEYRLIGVAVVSASVASALGLGELVLRLWLLPLLLVAIPLHFIVELPEHVMCDESRDVLRNTRSITGSRLSRWFTNGNNLHIEHHAAMGVPLQQLPDRHPYVQRTARHVERSYWTFYRRVIREVVHQPRRATSSSGSPPP
ncbi:fatty acid desaturase [Nonomuraea sp. NPDC050786]|uniref:fatty acid desaturase family protein n=1 Tax=Nonomuraea sp. NPDC050786 TaxID=3154840 RepID=UPI003404339E